MKFTVSIDCSNAAFGETTSELSLEIGWILSELLKRLQYLGNDRADVPGISYALRDTNGNRVGEARFDETKA